MKKKFFWLVLSLMTLFLVACGGEKKEETTDSANTNTEISGKIVIYTSMYEDIIDNVSEKLKKEFPNLEVEFFQGGTGTLQSKIIAELQANKLGCDMLMVAEPSYSLELKEKGILHPYLSKNAENLALDYDKEGYWYPVRISNMVLAYNPEKTKRRCIFARSVAVCNPDKSHRDMCLCWYGQSNGRPRGRLRYVRCLRGYSYTKTRSTNRHPAQTRRIA